MRLVLKAGFGFKKIWVIESLPEGDKKTGKEIYDDVLVFKQLKDPDFLIEYIPVNDKDHFLRVLKDVESDVKKTGQVPLLHIDTHGSKKGFQLKSKEFIRYEEMLPVLSSINLHTQNNLFIVACACHGEYLFKLFVKTITQRCPFWGILGPSDEIPAGDAYTGLAAFYDEVFNTNDINKGLEKLRNAIPQHASKFNILNSEYMFLWAFRSYIDNLCTTDQVEKRTHTMLNKLKQDFGDTLNYNEVGKKMKTELCSVEGQKAAFNRITGRFFFHDIFPKSVELPKPTFDQVMKFQYPKKSG